MVAGRYLRARKAEGFVSVTAAFSFLGIMLGVATLIIVMSVMNGFRQELLGRVLGLNGHMNIYADDRTLEDYEVLSLRVADLEGVSYAFPMIEGQALLTTGTQASGVVVRAYKPGDFRQRPIVKDSLISGTFNDFRDNNVAIGIRMAERLGVLPGDDITLVAPKGKVSPFGTIPRSRSYNVGAVFDVGMHEYNNNFVYMPLDAAQKFYQLKDSVKAIEIFVPDPERLDAAQASIASVLPPDTRIYDWRKINNSLFNALQVERNVMFLILMLIILVAAFNIISSMIMLVKDKGKDIAIMRTMGASRYSMQKIFMLTGASIGIVGTIGGAALGVAFASNIEVIRQWLEGLLGTELFSAEIYFLSQMPSEIDWGEVVAIISMAFLLTILATIYPARRAARLDPVEALRYE